MNERVSFSIRHMQLDRNKSMINHIYESSLHDRKEDHPLVLICQAMTESYPVKVQVALEGQQKAYVTMEFDSDIEKSKINVLSRRFQYSTEKLLAAKLVRIYEKCPL